MTNQTFQLSRRKFLTQSLTALGGVSLLGSLSGCGPSPDNSNESKSTSSATPKHGGVIRLGLIGGQQSGSLDPHLSASGSGITRGFAIYNKLWEWDENMLPRLALAEFAEPNHNASEWTIRLRKGLEFHHGKTITADDVIFSVKRLTDPKLASPFRNLVQWIDRDRIQKLDEYTVRIPFISTIPGFVALPETWVNFGGIVPTDFDPIHNPVGAGPYKVKEFIPGQRSVFIRFNNYFKADKPYADSFEVIDFKDQVSRLNALLAGQIDVANAISPEYIKILEQAKHNVCMEFLIQPRTSTKMLVEDAMTEWKENEAPFYQVATIHIPKQSFDTPEQNQFCENLSFTPWHALPEHKPLGAINRMRKIIYENISRVRHDINSAPRQEPKN